MEKYSNPGCTSIEVENVITTILDCGAAKLYDKYIGPKLKPYGTIATFRLSA